MPRFVILEHDWPYLHWDLMLEVDGALQTWRLAEPPPPDHPVAAERIGDHRLAYLDYEGAVSGGRGWVKRWEEGVYEAIRMTNDECLIQVCGSRMIGALEIKSGIGTGVEVNFREG